MTGLHPCETMTALVSQLREEVWKRVEPRSCWPASLAYLRALGSAEGSVSKVRWREIEEDT